MQHHTATPAKLRDGSWGARIVGAQAPKAGETCTIRTSTGKTWDATIARVLWSGKDAKTGEPVALCTTASTEPRPRRDPVARQAAAATRAMGRRPCRECGGEIQSWCRGPLCHDCE